MLNLNKVVFDLSDPVSFSLNHFPIENIITKSISQKLNYLLEKRPLWL